MGGLVVANVDAMVGKQQGRTRSVQSFPGDPELRLWLCAYFVALPPPKQLLSESWIVRGVVRQSLPRSVRTELGPQLLRTKPKTFVIGSGGIWRRDKGPCRSVNLIWPPCNRTCLWHMVRRHWVLV